MLQSLCSSVTRSLAGVPQHLHGARPRAGTGDWSRLSPDPAGHSVQRHKGTARLASLGPLPSLSPRGPAAILAAQPTGHCEVLELPDASAHRQGLDQTFLWCPEPGTEQVGSESSLEAD